MFSFDDSWYETLEDDPWLYFNMGCGGYCSGIDRSIIQIVECLCKKQTYYSEIAKQLELDEQFVELVLYILCSNHICDYGVSPRGCWIDHSIDKEKLMKAFISYFEKTWKMSY